MESRIQLYETSVPSTEFDVDSFMCGTIDGVEIHFSHKRNGEPYRSGILFQGVSATRQRVERCCTGWHIDSAYDTLVEVRNSSWVKKLRKDTDERWRDTWETHHYLIYLDSGGCFEVIAESWEEIPERAGAWQET